MASHVRHTMDYFCCATFWARSGTVQTLSLLHFICIAAAGLASVAGRSSHRLYPASLFLFFATVAILQRKLSTALRLRLQSFWWNLATVAKHFLGGASLRGLLTV